MIRPVFHALNAFPLSRDGNNRRVHGTCCSGNNRGGIHFPHIFMFCFVFILSLTTVLMFLTSSLPLSHNTFQFVNRQFLQDGAYTSGEKEQRDEWSPETEVGTFASSSNYYHYY